MLNKFICKGIVCAKGMDNPLLNKMQSIEGKFKSNRTPFAVLLGNTIITFSFLVKFELRCAIEAV